MPRKIIFNADDFGLDADTVAATQSLLLANHIKSATILVGQPATAAALDFARKHQKDQSFGLHFNMAEWLPPSGQPRPSLTGKHGQFNSPIKQRLKALTGAFNPEDVAAELEFQLACLRDCGLRISHVDSHGHLHKFPAVLKAMSPVLARFGITRLRIPQTHYDNPRLYNRALDGYCRRAFRGRKGITDYFFNTRIHQPNWLGDFLEKLPPGTTEIGIHPGKIEPWRKIESEAVLQAGNQHLLQNMAVGNISYLDIEG